jgi:hypothetical protein
MSYTHLVLWDTEPHMFASLRYWATHIWFFEILSYTHLILWDIELHMFGSMRYWATHIWFFKIPSLWDTESLRYWATYVWFFEILSYICLLLRYWATHIWFSEILSFFNQVVNVCHWGISHQTSQALWVITGEH